MTVPSEERVTVARDVDLAVYRWGSPADPATTPFVLLHGLASNARMWFGVGRRLAAAGHPVIAVDQRGHGRSDKPDDGYDFVTITDDLVAVLDHYNLRAPVVAGQSWGGNVVVEFAARFPGRTSGIVPVDGGFIQLGDRFATWEACAAQMAPPRFAGTPFTTFERWSREGHADWPEEGIEGAFGNVEVRADGTVAPWLSFEHHMSILRSLYEHRPLERVEEIHEPVLWMLADSGEAAWSKDKRAAMDHINTALARSEAHWIAGHHDLHAQQPDVVTGHLLDAMSRGFLGSVLG